MSRNKIRYLQLRCETCSETFKPLCSDTPGELLWPDYERVAEEVKQNLADSLRAFHRQHAGHRLAEIPA